MLAHACNLTLKKRGTVDQKFQAVIGYAVSLQPTCAYRRHCLKLTKQITQNTWATHPRECALCNVCVVWIFRSISLPISRMSKWPLDSFVCLSVCVLLVLAYFLSLLPAFRPHFPHILPICKESVSQSPKWFLYRLEGCINVLCVYAHAGWWVNCNHIKVHLAFLIWKNSLRILPMKGVLREKQRVSQKRTCWEHGVAYSCFQPQGCCSVHQSLQSSVIYPSVYVLLTWNLNPIMMSGS